MQIHEIKRNSKNRKSKQVGRGGTRGKTSGRGMKGQKARSGRKLRPQLRDTLKKIPKRRGRGINLNTSVTEKRIPISLTVLENNFDKGEVVTPKTLFEKGVIEKKGAKIPKVKILANGEIKKALTVEGCEISATAKEMIEKSGGKVS
ncbi:uL15 family ribosomal protein [Candidatus Nomurabacteria bacterium]|nr:uL15 family ribosomal protein [Candidatus Nomurabacteria bacterium]USN94789.1 MAG: uL15 family ribosomal protein [Candidatus Nomurabacteria bacterium]